VSTNKLKIDTDASAASVVMRAGLVAKAYDKLKNNTLKFKQVVDRPLTLSEKIIIGHLDEEMYCYLEKEEILFPGKSYVFLRPDRVALQDVTGQMAILQFMQSGIERTKVPTTIHCDHLIKARIGSEPDTKTSLYENNEVYQFLGSASRKYGIGF
jgi:aconitate hydratase